MFELIKNLKIPKKHKAEFARDKFRTNNLRILMLSIFLFFEQSYYGLIVQKPGNLVQQIQLLSASVMIIFAIISAYFKVSPPKKISLVHKIYELSIGITGLTIAIMRVIFNTHQVFRLPTVYIAVLYGMAVYFYYNYAQSFVMYFVASLVLIFILPSYKPHLDQSYYLADVISNSLIAWLVSMLNYYGYVKNFLNQKLVKKKNQQLEEKNEEIKKINQKLEKLIVKDDLTDIYNRRKLDEEIERFFAKSQRYDMTFSLILLDLDHFKLVNDNYGHNTGDKVLKEFSQLLVDNIREVDICGRWGGEEFLVVCPATELEAAENLAQRLRKIIESNDFTKVGNLTSSLGVATYREDDDIESLIKRVDDCLYQAKDNGRNTVVSQTNI